MRDWLAYCEKVRQDNGMPSYRALAKALPFEFGRVGELLRGEGLPADERQARDLLEALGAVGAEVDKGVGLYKKARDGRPGWRLPPGYADQVRDIAPSRLLDRTERPALTVAAGAAGWLLGEVTSPFTFGLEVHRAIDITSQDTAEPPALPELPAYVTREHDGALARVVEAAAGGASGIAVLVGGSSTGKTRACWEALELLRGRPEPWRLWHPINPTRAEAALADLGWTGPYTVVWLNEAQSYLDPAEPGLGERVAAGLRELLRDPARAPVLVLATLWPGHWGALTAPTSTDAHPQARELLEGHAIWVPHEFGSTDLALLASQTGDDARLDEAAGRARDGQITQYLAGVPVLLDRYHAASPATRALIWAAMDARRLGCGSHLPLALLQDAVRGYLTDTEEEQAGGDWLPRALDYATAPCRGIPGVLTRVETTAARNRRTRATDSKASTEPQPGPLYRLADYLDQHGRVHRAGQIPPIDFWTATAGHAHPADLYTLGDAAWARGLYRDAAQLYKHAIAHRNHPDAALALLALMSDLDPTDRRPAQWAVPRIALDDPITVAQLLRWLQEADAQEQVTVLLARDPASCVSLDYLGSVGLLLVRLREAGAQEQVTALSERAIAHVFFDDQESVGQLLDSLREAGAHEQFTALAVRAASHVPLDDLNYVAGLLDSLQEAGAHEQVTALVGRAIASVSLDDPKSVGQLLDILREEEVTALLARDPASRVSLDYMRAVAGMLDSLREAGAHDQFTALAARAIAGVSLDDPKSVGQLLDSLREAGAQEEVTALLARDPAAYVALDDLNSVATLLDSLQEAGAHEQATALATRAATNVSLDALGPVATLLGSLRKAGAHEQADVLLARDPAAHVSFDDLVMGLVSVTWMLDWLREAGEQGQVIALAARAAAHVSLDEPYGVAALLGSLGEAGAHEQAAALLARDPAAQVVLDHPYAVGQLLDRLREAGAHEQFTALADRAAAHVPLDHPYIVAGLLDSLREAGAHEQAAVLLARDPAGHVSLDHPVSVGLLVSKEDHLVSVGLLVGSLWLAGAHEQATALADRAAAHVYLGYSKPVGVLADVMRQIGAHEQATALTERLPAAGRFSLFMGIGDHKERFRFGREPDGTPAEAWDWADLD